MKSTIKTRWLKRLRSGDIRHNRGRMYDPKNNRYSALGVLCLVTGNMLNRDMSGRYPREDDKGIMSFVGLTPGQQKRIEEINQTSNDFSDVIRYISRNVKAR